MNRHLTWTFLALAVAASLTAAVAHSRSSGPSLSSVPARPRAVGHAPASQLSAELRQTLVAQGSMPLENPEGIIGWYGYENDVPAPDNPDLPQMIPSFAAVMPTEAQKTEPDKNTYLVLEGQKGADPDYDYGTHFLFQGHELAATVAGAKRGYVTRINLDGDTLHRVTLMATHDSAGIPIAPIDGSTWDPFAQRLLFTTESTGAPTYAATVTFPSMVEDVSGALGRGGYEGIQNDSRGNIWIAEDISGPNKQGTTARQPAGFIYRYVPRRPGDLHHGRLQVLQVLNEAGQPVTFESQAALCAPDQVALRTYGRTFRTSWVTIHDTDVDGNVPFNANTAAKAGHGTPFKRPENGVFRPGTHFREFYFAETGDTNATSPENGGGAPGTCVAGGWTSIFKVVQRDPSEDHGVLALVYEGNLSVAGLDNVQFLSRDILLAVEDAGDTVHGQRKALDSGYALDVTVDHSTGAQPIRWLAEGRDASATIDSAAGGFGKNEGDNEITGIHISDGDASANGILGAKVPHVGHGGWRWFWTQQHGDNLTWEVTLAGRSDRDD